MSRNEPSVYITHIRVANCFLLCVYFLFWWWKYSANLIDIKSVFIAVLKLIRELLFWKIIKITDWMCVKDRTQFTCCIIVAMPISTYLQFYKLKNPILLLLLLLVAVYSFLNTLTVIICLQWKCVACYIAPTWLLMKCMSNKKLQKMSNKWSYEIL